MASPSPKPGPRGHLPMQSFESELALQKLRARVSHLRREAARRRTENIGLKADLAAYEEILRRAGLL